MMVSTENKKALLILGILSLLGLILGVLACSEERLFLLYLFWDRSFLVFIQGVCVAAVGSFFVVKFIRSSVFRMGLRLIFGIIFLPVLLLPVFRCYFQIPYVFCSACAGKCPWGLLRGWVFSTAVLLNISGKFWCSALCPFGAFQEAQAQVSGKNVRLLPFLAVSLYFILILSVAMYLLTLFGLPWVKSFEIGLYTWGTIAMFIIGLIFVGAFFVPRLWCRYFCPVGAIAELTQLIFTRRSSDDKK